MSVVFTKLFLFWGLSHFFLFNASSVNLVTTKQLKPHNNPLCYLIDQINPRFN